MVDAAVVMIDNVHKKLSFEHSEAERKSLIIEGMKDVGPSIFFSPGSLPFRSFRCFHWRRRKVDCLETIGIYEDL